LGFLCSHCVPTRFPIDIPNVFPSHSHVFWNPFPMHHTSKNSTPITYLLHSHYVSRYTHTYVMSACDWAHISPHLWSLSHLHCHCNYVTLLGQGLSRPKLL
jgi:hypothetical protein